MLEVPNEKAEVVSNATIYAVKILNEVKASYAAFAEKDFGTDSDSFFNQSNNIEVSDFYVFIISDMACIFSLLLKLFMITSNIEIHNIMQTSLLYNSNKVKLSEKYNLSKKKIIWDIFWSLKSDIA